MDCRISTETLRFFGGYFDARELLKAIASGTRFDENGQQPWKPSEQARRTFRNELIGSVEEEEEREFLARVFVDGVEPSPQELENLSVVGRIVYRLLSGVSLEEAEELLGQLPEGFQEGLGLISPSRNLGGLKARMLIMHDAKDDNVPVEESRRLAVALKERGDVRYTEFVFFQHMDPARAVNPLTWTRDVFRLYSHLYQVIRVAS